jgi:hypothetical protein
MATQNAFWLDDSFDREHAADGRSRYAEEVRQRVDAFADAWGDIAPVTFAVTAWRLATTLSPPVRALASPHRLRDLFAQPMGRQPHVRRDSRVALAGRADLDQAMGARSWLAGLAAVVRPVRCPG